MTAGKNFVAYVGLDSAQDADIVTRVLKKLKTGAPGRKLAKVESLMCRAVSSY